MIGQYDWNLWGTSSKVIYVDMSIHIVICTVDCWGFLHVTYSKCSTFTPENPSSGPVFFLNTRAQCMRMEYRYMPGTQMTFVLLVKGLVLEGFNPQNRGQTGSR